MHSAAMKPSFLKEQDIPDSLREEILASEKGKKALKQFIKRDVLWQQDMATSSKSMSVGKYLAGQARSLKTEIAITNWALFQIK
mmetsp:Transcript_42322/g.64920  ORF Transcript_42322/g.64920 Transcript_42322/m.64920 type:complete len:84 (-) Transcript_42322:8-259(-)